MGLLIVVIYGVLRIFLCDIAVLFLTDGVGTDGLYVSFRDCYLWCLLVFLVMVLCMSSPCAVWVCFFSHVSFVLLVLFGVRLETCDCLCFGSEGFAAELGLF